MEMIMKLTLNVGCGDRTFDEYPAGHKCINFDERANLKRVDEVGNVKDLSRFPDEHFDYILASDIIEHFPISETNNILTEWKRVLIVGGVIEFRLPDLAAICKKYVDGKHDAKLTSWLLYGGQTYPGNFHYVGFDRKWLVTILKGIGFSDFEVRDADNNFELKARKK
jgi:predicted SAM-dependent methyltransferase